MKIAMLTNNYKPFVGGVPISVERQAKELSKLGHEVTVFAPEYKQAEDIRPGEQFEDQQQTRRERVIRYKTSSRKMENGMVYPRIISREIIQALSLIHICWMIMATSIQTSRFCQTWILWN